MKKYPLFFTWLGIEPRTGHGSGPGNGRIRSERKAVIWLIGLTGLTAAVFCLPPSGDSAAAEALPAVSAAPGAADLTESTAFSVSGAAGRPIEAAVPEGEADPVLPADFTSPADSVSVRDATAFRPAPGSAGGTAPGGNPTARGDSRGATPGSPVGRGGKPAADTFPVYICGAVRRPGVLRAAAGAVLDDLVRQCGGFTETADAAAVNLAMAVVPNSRIYIPSVGETPEARAGSGFDPDGGAGATGGGLSGPSGITGKPGGAEVSGASAALVNLNTADLSQLCGLPGIGERTAARILADRARNGPFADVEDLMRVPGIKAGKLEALRPLIFVG